MVYKRYLPTTHPETNIFAPENGPSQKGKNRIPNMNFQNAKNVSFRECNSHHKIQPHSWISGYFFGLVPWESSSWGPYVTVFTKDLKSEVMTSHGFKAADPQSTEKKHFKPHGCWPKHTMGRTYIFT